MMMTMMMFRILPTTNPRKRWVQKKMMSFSSDIKLTVNSHINNSCVLLYANYLNIEKALEPTALEVTGHDYWPENYEYYSCETNQ